MSSPCLSGGGTTYGFDSQLLKSPSITSSITSQISSPSSALSEASNSPLTISTRKPRTPRKRPNQTYNEAAAILSTAYPSIFSYNNHLSNSRKFTKPHDILLLDDPSELLLPFRVFDNSGFLISQPIIEKTLSVNEPKVTTPTSCDKSWQSNEGSMELCDDDLDAESILDEEIKEGIDSIMGNAADASDTGAGNDGYCNFGDSEMNPSCWYGYPMGYNFGTKGVRALRHVDHGNLLDFPIVDMFQISPRLNTNKNNAAENTAKSNSNRNGSNSNSGSKPKLSSADKKKKKKVEKPVVELKKLEIAKESITTTEEEEENLLVPKPSDTAALLLKLNYNDVLNAWSDRGSPFSEEFEGNDVPARLPQIDWLTEGGMREASVLRYKEKRRTRLFSNKIRYQVRKVNADRRPRMKGRFVRRPNSSVNT